jgi:Spy/CpxP family protein refolding chaperone
MNRTTSTFLTAAAATTLLAFAVPSFAQTQPAIPPSTHPATPPAGVDAATHAAHLNQAAGAQPGAVGDANADLVNQIAALRAEVAKLQAALMQGHTPQAPTNPSGGKGMGMGMGGTNRTQGPMGGGQMQPMQPMPAQPMPGAGGMAGMSGGGAQPAGGGMPGMAGGGGGMSMDAMMANMDGMMKMMGMGSMPMGGAGSPAAMAMPSAFPGFPGASHIYHIGATGFFLDHSGHITLTLEQQTALSQQKEQALLQQAELQRKIEQAEQELWVLTAADQPDAVAIEQKVQEVARKQGEQRLAFIRAVGEAAKVLTDEQRKQLTGMLPPAPTPMAPATPAAPGMPAAGGMSDM